jgi:hypothetical protein
MAALATLLIAYVCASWRSTAICRTWAPDQSCRAPTTTVKRMCQVFADKGITFASGALTFQTGPHRPVAGLPGEIPGAVPPPVEAQPKLEPPEVPARVLSARGVA